MHKNDRIAIFSHSLVWIVLFSMPYVLSYGAEQDINRLIAHFWLPLVFSSCIFYLNYIGLIDTFLFSRKMGKFILINAVLIFSFIFLKQFIEGEFFKVIIKASANKGGKYPGPPLTMVVYIQFIMYLAPLLFSIALKTTQRWFKTEAERKESANIKLQSEIQHLHYQLQPHFFFNSLNNIYALIDISPDQAKSSIHSLSKLMRYMLYETNVELLPLSKEIDFMKKYIDLMKLRVSDKTEVSYSFPTKETGINIAPLLFISLIENAFKHGVSASKESSIDIKMATLDKKIIFTIKNNNFPKRTDDKSGSGMGIPNIQKRLELLYPNKNIFNTIVKDDCFIAHLEIETT